MTAISTGLTVIESGQAYVKLRWDAQNSVILYNVDYRLPGTQNWTSLETSSTEVTATGLSCGTVYQFTMIAHGDGVTYKEWSDGAPLSANTAACSQ